MKTRVALAGFLAIACWLAHSCPAVAQQDGQPAPGIESSGPSVSSETPSSAPSQTENLSLEVRGDVFMARKSYADALEAYQRALRAANFKDAKLWNKIGIARQNMEDFSGARRAYQASIRLKKDFSEPYNNIGTTYYLEGKARKSLKWYRQAIENNPSNPAFHYNLGSALYATKKIEESIAAYRYTLRLDPGFFTNRSGAGTTLHARPADAKYFYYMAKVFASLGRSEEAVQYLRRALEDGFKDFDLIDQDPDFKTIAEFPPYAELRANPPKPL